MFKFFKDKIKSAISSISTKIEETKTDEQIKEEVKEQIDIKPQKKSILKKIKEKVTTTTISQAQFNELFSELEISLLENNVAYEVIDKIKNDLSEKLVNNSLKRSSIADLIRATLKTTIQDILTLPELDLLKMINSKQKPVTILVFGYNGVGKSLTVSKLGKYLKDNKLKVLY